MTDSPAIGFIGQGWIGKSYADDFERRGYRVVRYAKEPPHDGNAAAIRGCDVVFIAVPTPTTPAGFDDSIVREVLALVGPGKTAVIKSTLLPGTTAALQRAFPDRYVMHSPEFLSVATARHDAEHPTRNIVGIPIDTPEHQARARQVLELLPPAPYAVVCGSLEAELIKYGRNCLGLTRVVFVNLLYDLATQVGARWDVVRDAMAADPDNGGTYMNPVHKGGRGAGGECFIKDFEAFRRLYEQQVGDALGARVLASLSDKNIALLLASNKDLRLLTSVHGPDVTKRR